MQNVKKKNKNKLSKPQTIAARIAKAEALLKQKESEGYHIDEKTISFIKANTVSILLCIPAALPIAIPFILLNPAITQSGPLASFIMLIAAIALIISHELIHGVCNYLFNGRDLESIEFGIADGLTPYCTCQVPLKRWQYIIVLLAPTIILGYGLGAVAIIAESWLIFILSMLMVLGGGGDLTIILLLLGCKKRNSQHLIVLDHPSKCGCYVMLKDDFTQNTEVQVVNNPIQNNN
jgi:hypothetical protein